MTEIDRAMLSTGTRMFELWRPWLRACWSVVVAASFTPRSNFTQRDRARQRQDSSVLGIARLATPQQRDARVWLTLDMSSAVARDIYVPFFVPEDL